MSRQVFREFLDQRGSRMNLSRVGDAEIDFTRFLEWQIRAEDADAARKFFLPFAVPARETPGTRRAEPELKLRVLNPACEVYCCTQTAFAKRFPDVHPTIAGLTGTLRVWRWRLVTPLELAHALMRGQRTTGANVRVEGALTSFVAVLPHDDRQDEVYTFERPTVVSSLRNLHQFKVEDMCLIQQARPTLLYLTPVSEL